MFDQEIIKAINFSIDHDKHLAKYEVLCAREHLKQMTENGAINPEDAQAIGESIDAIATEIETGVFSICDQDEDIHSAFERRLTQICGETGQLLYSDTAGECQRH